MDKKPLLKALRFFWKKIRPPPVRNGLPVFV
jgi:hypothetical protein